MKIELILSKTFIHHGKVYNKGFVYQVADKVAKYLLSQVNERQVPYFRRTIDDDAAAVLPATKSTNKGGKPQPVPEAEELTPAQKAARTRAANKKAAEEKEAESDPDADDEDEPSLEPEAESANVTV